jgi:hypothetical protein
MLKAAFVPGKLASNLKFFNLFITFYVGSGSKSGSGSGTGTRMYYGSGSAKAKSCGSCGSTTLPLFPLKLLVYVH